MSEGWVSEIFRSIQGEGIYAGFMQVFVRFSGCSLECSYCDTPKDRSRQRSCSADLPGGEVDLENPVSSEAVSTLVLALSGSVPGLHSISITGGEPLEQPDFLRGVIEGTAGRVAPIYLETNGYGAGDAPDIARSVDIVSLDIKLPSLCGGRDTFSAAAAALEVFEKGGLFCKVVVAEGAEAEEVREAARIVAKAGRGIPLVIQPVSPRGGCSAPSAEELLEYHADAASMLDHVRVIPQIHGLLRMR